MIKNEFIQKVRGVLIFMVIIIHAIYESNNTLENYFLIVIRQLCNVAVPTFFFISGYNIKLGENRSYYVERIKKILIPLLF